MNSVKALYSKAFNLSVLQKSRLQWVDYLKGIAILMVVYRHVLLGIERSNIHIPDSLVNANMVFYSFRMPLFFILSGMFISSSIA
jgi:fucose 4-O-acetylase-like acetyltransferase